MGKDGRWHPGWDTINFVPDAKENTFLSKISNKMSVAFEHFVNPNRRTAFYGSYYLQTRLAIQRLEEEGSQIRKLMKTMTAPPKATAPDGGWSKSDSGSEKSWRSQEVKVPIMEVEIDAGSISKGTFDFKGLGYGDLQARLKTIDNEFLTALRFNARATELAFYKGRGEQAGVPSWIKQSWSPALIGRTEWRRLASPNSLPVDLRYRIRAKSIEMPVK